MTTFPRSVPDAASPLRVVLSSCFPAVFSSVLCLLFFSAAYLAKEVSMEMYQAPVDLSQKALVPIDLFLSGKRCIPEKNAADDKQTLLINCTTECFMFDIYIYI